LRGTRSAATGECRRFYILRSSAMLMWMDLAMFGLYFTRTLLFGPKGTLALPVGLLERYLGVSHHGLHPQSSKVSSSEENNLLSTFG